MINKLLLALPLVACCVYAGAVSAQPAKDADRNQILALEKHFASAFRAKDIDGIMKVYAPGADLFVFDVTPPREYVGWDNYKKDWRDFFAVFKGSVTFDISDVAVATDGALGYGHSIQHLSGMSADGKPISITVRVTDDYRKVGGKWYIVQEHVSVPVDLATGKADLQSKP
jgi:ketosteroid isomerase-like protein